MFKTYTIGELCTWCKGYQVPRDDTSVDKEIPYLHYGDLYKMYDFRLDLPKVHDSIIKIDPSDSIKGGQYLHDGDIVFALTSETVDDLGHCTLICNPDDLPFVSGMETTIIHVENRASVLPSYLNYYFQSSRFQRELRQFVTGMKVYRVHPDDIMKMSISIPDLSEQQRVVAVLNNLSDRVSILSAINDNLVQIRNNLFNKWLSDNCGSNYVSSSPGAGFVSLDKMCIKVTDGSHFSPPLAENGTHAMFSVKDMRAFGFDYSDCKMIDNASYESMKKNGCVPEIDDVLIAKDGSYLKQIFLVNNKTEDAILSSIAIFKPDKLIIYPEILLAFLQSPAVFNYVRDNFVSGSAIPRIVLKSFKQLHIKLPDLTVQDQIIEPLRSIRNLIEANNQQASEFSSVRDYLLPKLMSGEIDVSTLKLPTKYSFV